MTMKKPVLMLVWGAALIVWVAVAGIYFTEPSKQQWVIAVTVAAVVTEVAFWATAAIMGLSLFESRRQVMRWITGPFRKH